MTMNPDPNAPVDVRLELPIRDRSMSPARAGKYDLTYVVHYGPFSRTTITLPEEDATPDKVTNMAREIILKLKSSTPKPFQV